MQLCRLPSEIIDRVFTFGQSLENFSKLSSVCWTFHDATWSPASWDSSEIYVPAELLSCSNLIDLALCAWSRCACLWLAAAWNRSRVQDALCGLGFEPKIAVAGTGPVPLLYVGRILIQIGDRIDVTLQGAAEIQMCHNLLEGSRLTSLEKAPVMGIVLQPSCCSGGDLGIGSSGVLARIQRWRWRASGACEVTVTAESYFETCEMVTLTEHVDGSSVPLGFVTVSDHGSTQWNSSLETSVERQQVGQQGQQVGTHNCFGGLCSTLCSHD